MHDREQPAAAAMHGKMLQSAGTPVLRKLLRREQRPGGSRFDSGGSAAKRMQHPFEGCEQPGVSPAYPLLGKRIVQHIHERGRTGAVGRSEEHTSELQSPYDLVCRLLLEKKKKNITQQQIK